MHHGWDGFFSIEVMHLTGSGFGWIHYLDLTGVVLVNPLSMPASLCIGMSGTTLAGFEFVRFARINIILRSLAQTYCPWVRFIEPLLCIYVLVLSTTEVHPESVQNAGLIVMVSVEDHKTGSSDVFIRKAGICDFLRQLSLFLLCTMSYPNV